MIFSRPKQFVDFLIWGCFGRALVAGLFASAFFGATLVFGTTDAAADFWIVALAVAASLVDAKFRHARFFQDFELIRELQGIYRKGDLKSLLHADLLVWNAQYAINFIVGLVGACLIVDLLLPARITPDALLRTSFLYGSAFYFANAFVWRLVTQRKVTAFLRRLKVDFAEQIYVRQNTDPAGD